jgi:hypothetical protein
MHGVAFFGIKTGQADFIVRITLGNRTFGITDIIKMKTIDVIVFDNIVNDFNDIILNCRDSREKLM